MNQRHRISTVALIICVLCESAQSQDYATLLRSVMVNGQLVAERMWKDGMEIRSEDFVQFWVAVRSASGDTLEAASYDIKLRDEETGQEQQRSQPDPRIEYKGLPHGSYTLRIQAQVSAGVPAAPLLIRFRVGSMLNIGQSVPAPENDTAAKEQPPVRIFPVGLWIVLALATSVISLVLALILLKHRRRSRITAHQYDRIRQELDASRARIEQLQHQAADARAQLESLRQTLADSTTRLEEHNRELSRQNQQLRQQVERLRMAKQQLEQLQEEKDALLSMIIHDIKNPLLVIEQLVQLLRSYDSNSADTQQILHDLAETTSRVVALSQQVTRLLSLERSDGLPLQMTEVNLTEILRSVVHRNAYLARRKEIQILEEIPESIPAICDPQRIEEVFDNILSNAIKYSHPNSVVIVRATSGGEHHTIEIEDHGVGMSSDDLQRLFERGRTLSSTPTAQEPSSGLGLWIARRIIERHGGTISVESKKGEGTVVTISLPVRITGPISTVSN
jgi:signal transduction histidine kinase